MLILNSCLGLVAVFLILASFFNPGAVVLIFYNCLGPGTVDLILDSHVAKDLIFSSRPGTSALVLILDIGPVLVQ